MILEKKEFRPYTLMKPIIVELTGKTYEIGEHPFYIRDRVIEVIDEQGVLHDAFEDELK